MQNEINRLKAFYKKTEQQIRAANIDPKGLAHPVYDGIVNPEAYLDAPLKIMWVLKEPYCDFDEHGNPKGGDWHTRDLVKVFIDRGHPGRSGTFRKIAYTTWALLNNVKEWDEIPNYGKGSGVLESLESIAFINVKKMIGETGAYNEQIQAAYNQDKSILLEQIEVANPQVVIFGYTAEYFSEDLALREKDGKSSNAWADYFFKSNRVYIDAYHPSYPSVGDEAYCMDIISIVDEWNAWKAPTRSA